MLAPEVRTTRASTVTRVFAAKIGAVRAPTVRTVFATELVQLDLSVVAQGTQVLAGFPIRSFLSNKARILKIRGFCGWSFIRTRNTLPRCSEFAIALSACAQYLSKKSRRLSQ